MDWVWDLVIHTLQQIIFHSHLIDYHWQKRDELQETECELETAATNLDSLRNNPARERGVKRGREDDKD